MAPPVSWKCLFGVHSWEHEGECEIGGNTHEISQNLVIVVGRLTIFYRKCSVCDKVQQYYPSTQN